MDRRALLTVVLAAGMAAAAPAWPESKPVPAQRPATTDVPEDRDPAPSMLQNVDIEDLSAQELRDKPVYDAKNQQIATVKSVTGTPGSDRQAILQTGGVLGIGGREVALPLNKIRVAPDGRLMLKMTDDELKLLPKTN